VHLQPVAQRGVVGEHPRGRLEQQVGGLERLDAADEQQDDGVVGDAEAAAGRRPVAGGEAV
jgi:hypothetical protein